MSNFKIETKVGSTLVTETFHSDVVLKDESMRDYLIRYGLSVIMQRASALGSDATEKEKVAAVRKRAESIRRGETRQSAAGLSDLVKEVRTMLVSQGLKAADVNAAIRSEDDLESRMARPGDDGKTWTELVETARTTVAARSKATEKRTITL